MARTNRLLKNIDSAEEALARAGRLLPEDDPSVAAESALLFLDKGDITAAAQPNRHRRYTWPEPDNHLCQRQY